MAELTFYPDAHPESTSVDGYAYNSETFPPGGTVGLTWAALVAAAGTDAADNTGSAEISFTSLYNEDEWLALWRAIYLFDTSALPDDATITGAVLSIRGDHKKDNLGVAPSVGVYASTPASNTALVAGDFANVSSTLLSDLILYDNWNEEGYNNFTLNADGLAAISKTGITKLCLRFYLDATGTPPAWSYNRGSGLIVYFADTGLGDEYKPKLVVTYTGGPTVTTEACTDIAPESLTGNGTIVSFGASAVTQHGHCWSTITNPTTADSKTQNGVAYNLGQFTSAITGLTPGTTYYIRAYATNTYGTSYGAEVSNTQGTTIGRRYIWIEGRKFHYFDEFGTERELEGSGIVAGDLDIPWWDFLWT